MAFICGADDVGDCDAGEDWADADDVDYDHDVDYADAAAAAAVVDLSAICFCPSRSSTTGRSAS